MKQFENITLTTSTGEIIKDQPTGKELNARNIILILLDNSKYENQEDQRRGFKLHDKVEKLPKKSKTLQLEDSEFDLVKKYADKFDPFLTGLVWMPFKNALADAKDVETK